VTLLAIVAGPVGAVFAIATPTTYDGATCGSALSASLERGVPDDAALDRTQRGCKDKGAATMRAAEAYGAASAGVAVIALLVAAVPGGGRPEPVLAA
jgi:hypothetical protein